MAKINASKLITQKEVNINIWSQTKVIYGENNIILWLYWRKETEKQLQSLNIPVFNSVEIPIRKIFGKIKSIDATSMGIETIELNNIKLQQLMPSTVEINNIENNNDDANEENNTDAESIL